MADFGKYILSVTAAAMVVGILSSLLDQKGSAAALLRLAGGVFLTLTVIQPIARFNFEDITAFAESYYEQAQTTAAFGEQIAAQEVSAIIKADVQAYILDKAQKYGAEIAVEVSLDDDNIPVQLRLSGPISPYAKASLQTMIEADLGISKENQLWTGQS